MGGGQSALGWIEEGCLSKVNEGLSARVDLDEPHIPPAGATKVGPPDRVERIVRGAVRAYEEHFTAAIYGRTATRLQLRGQPIVIPRLRDGVVAEPRPERRGVGNRRLAEVEEDTDFGPLSFKCAVARRADQVGNQARRRRGLSAGGADLLRRRAAWFRAAWCRAAWRGGSHLVMHVMVMVMVMVVVVHMMMHVRFRCRGGLLTGSGGWGGLLSDGGSGQADRQSSGGE